jgi:uncharacterized protein
MTPLPPPPDLPGPPPPDGPRRSGSVPPPPGHDDPPYGEAVDLRATSADAAFRVPFSLFDTGMVLFLYFLTQLVVGAIAAVAILASGAGAMDTNWVAIGLGASIVGFAAGLGWLRLRGRLSWRILGPVRPGVAAVGIGIAVGAVATLLTYLVNALTVLLAEPDAPVQQQVLLDALRGGWSLAVAAILAIVVAPVTEEVLFRGLLFQSLRRRVGLWPAAAVSSLLFASIHVEILFSQPLALAGLFVFAMALAWSFHRFGSLVVPIIAHAVFNATSLILAVLLERSGIVIG